MTDKHDDLTGKFHSHITVSELDIEKAEMLMREQSIQFKPL